MKRILILAIAAVAMVFTTSTDASAQSYSNGYAFGTGIGQSFRGGFGGGSRFTAPPYFAQFPPVYYNGIVRRPYGISPYAAPPGIAPVELHAIPEQIAPLTIKNTYVEQAQPVSTPKAQSAPKHEGMNIDNKTTWIKNPFYVPEVEAVVEVKIDPEVEEVLLAGFDIAEATLIDIAQMAYFKFN